MASEYLDLDQEWQVPEEEGEEEEGGDLMEQSLVDGAPCHFQTHLAVL